MNIPTEIENIIYDYKEQIEHSKKFEKCLKEIQNIYYTIITIDHSIRDNAKYYFYENNHAEILKIINDKIIPISSELENIKRKTIILYQKNNEVTPVYSSVEWTIHDEDDRDIILMDEEDDDWEINEDDSEDENDSEDIYFESWWR